MGLVLYTDVASQQQSSECQSARTGGLAPGPVESYLHAHVHVQYVELGEEVINSLEISTLRNHSSTNRYTVIVYCKRLSFPNEKCPLYRGVLYSECPLSCIH